jgi:hypothetical protein
MTGADLQQLALSHPYIAVYLLGIVTGWTLARRSIRYMLGGRFH